MDALPGAEGGVQASPHATRLGRRGSGTATSREPAMPSRREKPLGIEPESVPKPTQVGGYQYTKARERNLVKELGNLAP